MSSAELTEWVAFYGLEPFGGDTRYIGSAIVAATVANTAQGKKRKPTKVEDMMPKFERKREQSIDQQIQIAATFAASGLGTLEIEGENG